MVNDPESENNALACVRLCPAQRQGPRRLPPVLRGQLQPADHPGRAARRCHAQGQDGRAAHRGLPAHQRAHGAQLLRRLRHRQRGPCRAGVDHGEGLLQPAGGPGVRAHEQQQAHPRELRHDLRLQGGQWRLMEALELPRPGVRRRGGLGRRGLRHAVHGGAAQQGPQAAHQAPPHVTGRPRRWWAVRGQCGAPEACMRNAKRSK